MPTAKKTATGRARSRKSDAKRAVKAKPPSEAAPAPTKAAADGPRTRKSDTQRPVRKTRPKASTSVENIRGQRVLVAEDNKVTQDLLKLLLKQRGHDVEIVANGQDALKALENAEYDVVLMDFHLPKLDGVKVATAFRSNAAGLPTRFVAITADMEGLLGHVDNCENFDSVLPKPFDLERVVQVVEGKAEEIYVPTAQPVADAQLRPAVKPATAIERAHSQIQDLRHEFLRWPCDFSGDRLSARFLQAMLDDAGRFDAILVGEPAQPCDLTAIWATKTLHVLPVIDLTGSLGRHADLDGAALSVGETDKVATLVNDFHNRRMRVHPDVLFSDDLGPKLLGRAYATGGAITPGYDPSHRGMVGYNIALDASLVEQEAAKLCNMGYLERRFFDRFHQCGACGSSRLHVREECSECRSPDLHEEAYLHHFSCAYQGPESDFRHGDHLTCPKCRKELAHFGVDYDKPGSMMTCGSCHHGNTDPLVGFICLDCGAHASSDVLATRDVYGYALTDRGVGYVETGRAMLGRQHHALRLAHLPLEVIVAVNGELKAYHESDTPFVVLDISYGNQRQIERQLGVREFEQARDLFLENLNNTLRKEDLVIKGIAYDYAILKDVDPQEARDGLDYIRKEANTGLRHDLGVVVQVFTPEDFA